MDFRNGAGADSMGPCSRQCASAQGARREDARKRASVVLEHQRFNCAVHLPQRSRQFPRAMARQSGRKCRSALVRPGAALQVVPARFTGRGQTETLDVGLLRAGAPVQRRRHLYARPPFPNALSVSGDDSRWAHR